MHITQFRIGIDADNATGCVFQNNYINGAPNPNAIPVNNPVQGIIVGGSANGNLIEAGNLLLRNQVLNCQAGIISRGLAGNNYFESNVVYGCTIGIALANTDKYRFNTTIDCVTPFTSGIPLTDENN